MLFWFLFEVKMRFLNFFNKNFCLLFLFSLGRYNSWYKYHRILNNTSLEREFNTEYTNINKKCINCLFIELYELL